MRTLLSPANPKAAGALKPGVSAGGDLGSGIPAFDPAVLFAIVAFTFYVSVSLYGIAGRLLSITYPIGCLLIGALCFFRTPNVYIGFTFWVWLVTPFARRVYDERYGFHPTSTLLLAPLIVSAFAIITVIRRRRLLRNNIYIPFAIALAALTYAYLIGVIRQAVVPATYDLFTWVAPIAFGMHVALDWRRFRKFAAR